MDDAMTCAVCGEVGEKRATGPDLMYGLKAFWPEPQEGGDAAWETEFWIHRRCLRNAPLSV